jgi:hypothetical protein
MPKGSKLTMLILLGMYHDCCAAFTLSSTNCSDTRVQNVTVFGQHEKIKDMN